ncbi:hypothetical protein [Halobacillus litoralis]|uniref:hypothetical protein n=1 Tax=Halobacillus litoralis TaxID=45668 RepID=UPI001CFF4748|nr:hypothetical protein [Halobacillus litoralis]
MGLHIDFSGLEATTLMVLYFFVSILSLLIANASEDSIITDRINKYIFFFVSLIYSYIGPKVLMGAFMAVNYYSALNPTVYYLCVWGAFIGFSLVQYLVYRVLNTVDAK